jgi:peptide/nickel transport system substrate-binding protein
MRRFLIFLAMVFSVLMMVTGCGKDREPAATRITYGLTLMPSGFDPHINRSTELGIVLRQVYDTLVYREPDTGEFVPGLATEWTVSDDGLTYTFTLRQGVTFHDGTPFDALAVGANFDRITEQGTTSPSQKAQFMLGAYTGYEIIDPYTIRIALAEPYIPLLDSLSQVYLGIASPTAIAAVSRETYQFHQVGTGPFEFIEYVPGDRIVLRRFDDYAWGPEFYQTDSNGPLVDEIVFHFYEDEPTRTLALESGDADIMGEIPPVDARTLSGSNTIQLVPVSVPGQPLQFIFNTQRFPTDNPVTRQALIFATNRSAIVDTVFQGFSPIAWGPLSSPTLYYSPDVQGVYAYDPQRARDMLASLGYLDGDNNGYLDVGDGNLQVVLLVPNWGRVPLVAQLIQDQWREVGVQVILQPVPGFNALLEAVDSGEYNLASFDTAGLDPAFLNEFFATDGPSNWTGFSSTELDVLLQSAVQEGDDATRRAIYREIQRIIMNEALILPIREYVNLNAANARLQGLRFDPYGWFPLLNNVALAEG